MVRFSLDGDEIEADEDRAGPSNQKKQKLTTSTSSEPPILPQSPPVYSIRVDLEEEELLGDISIAGEDAESEDSVGEDEAEAVDSDYEEDYVAQLTELYAGSGNRQIGVIEELQNDLTLRVEETVNQESRVDEEPSKDGPRAVIIDDPDVLDCPICFELLRSPVFQCENGHIACGTCCVKIRNKCPSCSWPIGYNRCRAIEKVLEAVKVSCGNMKYGCKHTMKYCDKLEHEYVCLYSPCSCPLHMCDFVDSAWNIYEHFHSKHKRLARDFVFNQRFSLSVERNQSHLILREKGLGILFVLTHFIEHQHSKVNVVCIAPELSMKKYHFDLVARDGETSLRLQSFVENIPKLVDHPRAKNYLLVPDYFISNLGKVSLDVCILQHEE